MFDPLSLAEPVVQAPLAGGPSTVELAAAVSEAGGLGFLAAGYKRADVVRADIDALRAATDRPFGVNLFVPSPTGAEPTAVAAYAQRIAREADRLGAALGEPVHDDDDWEAKLALVADERPAVVSFTFGCPSAAVLDQLHGREIAGWVTVTSADEALAAAGAGADALIVQGTEAGGHRGGFLDLDDPGTGVLALLRVVAARTDLALIASGGIADGPALAAVLCAGAVAAQIGTALLLASESGAVAAYRERLRRPGPTRLTRAFSGRPARGIVNRFMLEHEPAAPTAYPEVNHLTSPLRAAARAAGDAEAFNLWAGQAHELARELPAGEIVRAMGAQARAVLRETAAAMATGPPAPGGGPP